MIMSIFFRLLGATVDEMDRDDAAAWIAARSVKIVWQPLIVEMPRGAK